MDCFLLHPQPSCFHWNKQGPTPETKHWAHKTCDIITQGSVQRSLMWTSNQQGPALCCCYFRKLWFSSSSSFASNCWFFINFCFWSHWRQQLVLLFNVKRCFWYFVHLKWFQIIICWSIFCLLYFSSSSHHFSLSHSLLLMVSKFTGAVLANNDGKRKPGRDGPAAPTSLACFRKIRILACSEVRVLLGCLRNMTFDLKQMQELGNTG